MAKAMIEFWQDLTTTEFEGLDPMSTLALLPVAAIEQHGPHLPLSTDLIINRGIVNEAITRLAPGVRVLVLTEPVGYVWMSQDLNPAGVVGNAARADAVRGSQLFDHLGSCLATLLYEAAAMPLTGLKNGPIEP